MKSAWVIHEGDSLANFRVCTQEAGICWGYRGIDRCQFLGGEWEVAHHSCLPGTGAVISDSPIYLTSFIYPTPDSPVNPPYQYSSKVVWCSIDLVGTFSWHKVLTKVAPCPASPKGCPWLVLESLYSGPCPTTCGCPQTQPVSPQSSCQLRGQLHTSEYPQ